MMKQMKNKTRATVKAMTVAVLATGAFILFSEKVIAQVKPMPKDPPTVKPPIVRDSEVRAVPPSGKGISEDEFQEYKSAVIGAYRHKTAQNGEPYIDIDTAGLNIIRLRSLYKNMSKAQQDKAPRLLGIVPLLPAPAKKSPSEEQFLSWQDASKYGVWMGHKKIDNKLLAKYKASDIAYFNVSKLYGRAKEGKTYDYQVNLYTHAQYDVTFKDWPKE